MKASGALLWLGVAAVGLVALGCGRKKEPTRDAYSEVLLRDDRSLCVGYDEAGHESEESSAPGAPGRSIRRVYAIVGSGQYMGRVLVCREVDTNYDGLKDLVRTYDKRGLRLTEDADTNYDGRLDTWTAYSNGRIGRTTLDKDYDGQVDEVRHYRDGRIVRIHRDTDGDGKEDTFEMYRDGKLERIGVDLDRSGHVDEWYSIEEDAAPSGAPADGAPAGSTDGSTPPEPPKTGGPAPSSGGAANAP